MSNNGAFPSSGFAEWRASVTRQVTSSPSSNVGQSAPAFHPPPMAQETVDQNVQHDQSKSHGRHKKGKKWQPLNLAAVAPNSFGPYQQAGPRAGTGFGNTHQGSQNANSHRGANQNFDNRRRQNLYPAARGQGLGHPIDMNGLSRGVNNLAIGGLRTLPTQEPSAPLTKFTIFGKLPTEMRLKIWALALNTDRILEVIWDGAEKDPKTASHYHYRISPRSGARPALMDVCHESRTEAERFYTLVDFTTTLQNAHTNFEKCGPIMTYYNPEWDILLFGEYSCMWSIVRVIQDQRHANVDIRRIAIVSSGQLLKCHDWNHDDPIHGPDQMEVDYGYAIAGGCTVMQALHGIHKDVAWTERASGVKGLKEVFFVVPTHLIPGIAGKVDESIGFRPARGSGLTSGQVRVKKNLQDEVDLIEAGGTLPYCSVDDSMNNWSGDNKPDFKFVTFAPKSYIDGMVFDSMIIASDDLPKLNGQDWKFIKNVERKSGCHVKIPKRDYQTQPSREIGIYGTDSGIEKAIKLIQEQLKLKAGNNWTKPKFFKIAPGYSTDLGLEFYHPQAAATKY